MRRKLAYILLSSALIFGGLATIGQTVTSLDTDVSYGTGKDMYFKISTLGSTLGGVSSDDYIQNDGYMAVDAVGEVFEERLETWGVNSTVTKEGYDTVKVTIRSQAADETEYSYIQRYLTHSGGNITVTAGSDDEDIQAGAPLYDTFQNNMMFEGQAADIRYVNNIPVVTIGVNYPGEEGNMAELIDYCRDNTVAADEETGTEAKNCYLVFWSNFQEGDSFAAAADSSNPAYDPNISSRLLFGESAAEAWFDDADDDNDYTRIQLIPNSSAIESGQFDESKAGAAYKAAFFYMNMLNASSYKDLNDIGYDVSYAYSTTIPATAEDLVIAGDWHLSMALTSYTAIASLVAMLAGLVIVACFYRLGVLAIAANASFTLIGTLMLFSYFSAQFGLGALIGLALSLLISAFGGIYYFAKFKEELYLGRTAKKAHTEAIKKSFWPTMDLSIVSILIGLCVYSLIPSVTGKLGLILVLGAFFAGVSNIFLLRLEGWLLANDSQTAKKLSSVYAVNEKDVPDLQKEEKPTNFGPFAKTDFHKGGKIASLVLGVLTLASAIGLVTFSAISQTPYNFASVYDDATVLSIEYKVQQESEATRLLSTVSQMEDNYLALISLDGKPLEKGVDYGDIILEESSVYSSDERIYYDIYHFNVPMNRAFMEDEAVFAVGDAENLTFNDALASASEIYGGSAVNARAQLVDIEPGLPSISSVYLGLGIGALAASVYMILRHKLARGLSLSLVSVGIGIVPLGFFALTRIPVTPIVSIGAIAVTILSFVLGSLILNKSRELEIDSRERDKSSLDFKLQMMRKGVSEGAGDFLIIALIALFAFTFYFGLGPSAWRLTFLGILLGLVLAVLALLYVLEPLSALLSSLFSKIRISLRKDKEKKIEQKGKKKPTEPEEAIFIGIND